MLCLHTELSHLGRKTIHQTISHLLSKDVLLSLSNKYKFPNNYPLAEHLNYNMETV